MKKFWLSLLAVCFIFAAFDCGAANDKKQKRIREKIKKSQAAKNQAKWHTELNKAVAEARQNNRQIFLLITGSTWCGTCMNLERNVLSSKDFARYAKKNLVLLKVDIPRSAKALPKPAQEILKKYHNNQGVPAVYLLNSEGKVVEKKVGYGGAKPKEYLKQFKKLER